MRQDRRFLVSAVWLVLGAVLAALGFAGQVDEFWCGMGVALILVGILRTVRMYRFRKDENYREKVQIETEDERNRFLRGRAWAWAGYLFILIAAVATIVLKVMGQDLLSMAASGAVCLMLVLYWGAYLVARKKY